MICATDGRRHSICHFNWTDHDDCGKYNEWWPWCLEYSLSRLCPSPRPWRPCG